MKRVPCSNVTCGESYAPYERPDEPRGTQMINAEDDWNAPYFCSIECYGYFKADHPELMMEHLISIPENCPCVWCKANPPIKRYKDKLAQFLKVREKHENSDIKHLIQEAIEKLQTELAELEKVLAP